MCHTLKRWVVAFVVCAEDGRGARRQGALEGGKGVGDASAPEPPVEGDFAGLGGLPPSALALAEPGWQGRGRGALEFEVRQASGAKEGLRFPRARES